MKKVLALLMLLAGCSHEYQPRNRGTITELVEKNTVVYMPHIHMFIPKKTYWAYAGGKKYQISKLDYESLKIGEELVK